MFDVIYFVFFSKIFFLVSYERRYTNIDDIEDEPKCYPSSNLKLVLEIDDSRFCGSYNPKLKTKENFHQLQLLWVEKMAEEAN